MEDETVYIILHVWEKAQKIEGYDSNIWRQDFAGAWIRRDSYGKYTKYGWFIDHLRPLSQGGSNELKNLFPLHWMNQQKKASDYPEFTTTLTSSANQNIEKEKKWIIHKK